MPVANAMSARAYVNGRDVSGDLNEISPELGSEVVDATTFGTVLAAVSVVTHRTATFLFRGFYSSDLIAGIDAILSPLYGLTALVVLWPAGDAAGLRGWASEAMLLTRWKVGSAIGELVTAAADWMGGATGAAPADLLTSIEPKTVVVGTGAQQVTTPIDNGASTPNGGGAYFQIFAIDASSGLGNFYIQHSADASTWAALGLSTLGPTVGAQRLAATGTVNRYVRRNIILGAGKSITIQTAVARNP